MKSPLGIASARRTPVRPMVGLSAVLHGLLAIGLVWGPSWIRPRPLVPAYEVQLVSLPVDEAPKPKPEPVRQEPPKPPPAPVKPKPKPVKKPAPPPVEKSKPSPKPAPSTIPEAADQRAEAEQPPEPPVKKPEQVAKATEPAEPGIQLVTPLMEAVALKYPFYTKALWRKINENWAPPGAGFAEAAREVLVVFTILPDGNISAPTIEQSSGDVFYDQAALRAVMRANPFPPLPPGYPEDRMKIYFSFSLDPDQAS